MADWSGMDLSSKPDLTAYTTYLHPEATVDDHRQALTDGGVENVHKAEHRKGPYVVVEQGNEWSLCNWVIRETEH